MYTDAEIIKLIFISIETCCFKKMCHPRYISPNSSSVFFLLTHIKLKHFLQVIKEEEMKEGYNSEENDNMAIQCLDNY